MISVAPLKSRHHMFRMALQHDRDETAQGCLVAARPVRRHLGDLPRRRGAHGVSVRRLGRVSPITTHGADFSARVALSANNSRIKSCEFSALPRSRGGERDREGGLR